MRLLVLGGTLFLGRHVVEAALADGHEVSLFTRGNTNAGLFPEAEHLRGDRDGDLASLEGGSWDAVIDTSGYVPRVVRASAELLRDSVGHYVFVSSISAYAEPLPPAFDESAPLHGEPATENVQEEYGALKAACERVVEQTLPGRSASIRAGLIVGPHDPTGRFTYWPSRAARGGDMLAPGDPDRTVQFVDARDLAGWMVHVAQAGLAGPFNATGPVPPATMGALLETCVSVSGSDGKLVWVEDGFLLEREVGEWMELPLWLVTEQNVFAADVSRAVAAGLTFRPLADTVRDTLEWARTGEGPVEKRQGPQRAPAGLAPEREAELLAAWSTETG